MMNNGKYYFNFVKQYETYARHILEPQHSKISSFFSRWREAEFWSKYARSQDSPFPSPIRAIYTRIKRPEKVADKIYNKPEIYPDGLSEISFKKMHDCIGVRIIVYFLSQLPMIDREIRRSKSMLISEAQQPEAYLNQELAERFGLSHIPVKQKENGYLSIHYVVRLQDEQGIEITPWFEIQVRTMAQELWCEMEHIMAYKSEQQTDYSAKRRFQILSREISAIDEHFNLIYEELLNNQENVIAKKEDQLNGENLPSILNSLGMRCAQQDLTIILNILQSRGICQVKDLLNLASPSRLENIKNTYRSMLGRLPTGFEVVSSLSALKSDKEQEETEKEKLHTHIKTSKSWNHFRKKSQAVINNSPRTYKW